MEQAIVIESTHNCNRRNLMKRIKRKKSLKAQKIIKKQTINSRKKYSWNELISRTRKLTEKKIRVNHFFPKILKRLFFHFRKPSMFFITKTMSNFFFICRRFGPKISAFISLRYQTYAHICRTPDKHQSLLKQSIRQFSAFLGKFIFFLIPFCFLNKTFFSFHVSVWPYHSKKSLRNVQHKEWFLNQYTFKSLC
jgi:hypothetical protein